MKIEIIETCDVIKWDNIGEYYDGFTPTIETYHKGDVIDCDSLSMTDNKFILSDGCLISFDGPESYRMVEM